MATSSTQHCGLNNYMIMMNELLTCPLCKTKYDSHTRPPIILHKNGYCTTCKLCVQSLTNGQVCPLCPKSYNTRWRVDLPQDSSGSFQAIESPPSSVCFDCGNEFDTTNKARCLSIKVCCTRCLQQTTDGILSDNFIINQYFPSDICPRCQQAYSAVNPPRCEQKHVVCTQCVRFDLCMQQFQTLETLTNSTCPVCAIMYSYHNPPKIVHSTHVMCRTCLIMQCFTKQTKRMKRSFWCPICSKPPQKIVIPMKFMEKNLFIQHLCTMLHTHHIDFRQYGKSTCTVPSTALPQSGDESHPRIFESYLHCLVSGFHKINSFLDNTEKQMYQMVASGVTHDMNRLVQLKIQSLVNLEHIAAEYVFTLYNLTHRNSTRSLGLQRPHYAMGIPEFPKSLFFIPYSINSVVRTGAIEVKLVKNPYVKYKCSIHIRIQHITKVENLAVCNSAENTPLYISCVCTPHLDFLTGNIEHFQVIFTPVKAGIHELSISNHAIVSKVNFQIYDLSQSGSQACQNVRCANCKYMTPCKTFKSHMTNEIHDIKQHITCMTTNIVYLMQCKQCGIQYVGETGDSMRQRMLQHRSVNPPSLAEDHFRLIHGLDNLQVIGIEKVSDATSRVAQEQERLNRESYWIKTLHTYYPLGLNALHVSHPRTPRKKLCQDGKNIPSQQRQVHPIKNLQQQQTDVLLIISDDSD